MDKKLFMVPAFFLVEADSEENAIRDAGHAMLSMNHEDGVRLVLDEELRIPTTNVPGEWITTMKGYVPGIPA